MKLNFFYYSGWLKQWMPADREGYVTGVTLLLGLAQNLPAGKEVAELESDAYLVVINDDRPDTAAKLSDFDRANVENIIADRAGGGGAGSYTNYGAHVIRLVKKADGHQRQVLRMVYPDHVEAVEAWEAGIPTGNGKAGA